MTEAVRRTNGAAEALVAELRGYLAGISEGKLRAEEIDPAGHLFDAGYVDSLTAVMLVAHLEEAYGVRIEDMDLVERLTTLDALASHVAAER
jgi:acyl carrier protein